jgi:hypothetical protein
MAKNIGDDLDQKSSVEKERISWGLFFSCHLREPRNITLTSDGNGGRAC